MVSAQIPNTLLVDSALPQLLQPTELVKESSRVIGPEVMRRRGVVVDVEFLMTLDPAGDSQIVFNLFPDTTFTGRVESKTFPGKWIGFPDAFSLGGSIQGIAGSSFQLLYLQGVLAADIRVPGKGEYQIRPTGPPGVHEVWKIDSSRFPSCAVGRQPQIIPPPADKDREQFKSSLVEVGSIIDVMIVYTTDARIASGGELNVILESAFAIINTNAAYVNSMINTQLRLVFLDELPYSESGSASTDLSRLTNIGDGFLDSVHTIRDAVGADIVSLFVSPSLDACGTSWLMSNVSPDFQSSAFNVCAINCAAVNLTYAHEVGHILGCQHNRESAGGVQGAFPYSFGYWEPTGVFRTVMALPNGSMRIMHFSNPLVEVLVPTGIPEGQANSADNAKTINITAFTVANFRPSGCSIPAPVFDCNSNCIEDIDDITIGISHDCNTNGIPDECEDDCNGNGIADTCDVADGGSSDCNSNSIPDECDVRNTFTIASTSGELSPIGLGFPVSHTFTSPPVATEDVTLRFAAIADLDSTQVQLDVYLNDVFLGHIFRNSGTLCPETPDEEELVVAMVDFNTLVNGGDAVISIETWDSAEFDACGDTSWVSVSLSNLLTRVGMDVNNNGIPDSCELALALGDSNFDGVINVTDLLNLLAAWGVCGGCVEDTNSDGLVNATDLLTLLGNWG